jgi:hypothetical protein
MTVRCAETALPEGPAFQIVVRLQVAACNEYEHLTASEH